MNGGKGGFAPTECCEASRAAGWRFRCPSQSEQCSPASGRREGLALLSPVCLIAQSSLGSAASFQPHVPYSPFRGMPPYSQLAASSLLSQQYAASLGLGE